MRIQFAASVFWLICFLTVDIVMASDREQPFLESELIFPLEHWHNHSSSIVQLPNGDLIVCWFHGSGERQADDVVILGARKKAGSEEWSPPFLLEDVPGYPDTNPILYLDPRERLWLMWPTILANEWHTALMKYRISTSYSGSGKPDWAVSRVLHLKPGEKFARTVEEKLDQLSTTRFAGIDDERRRRYLNRNLENSRNKFYRRLGWMSRSHPIVLDGGRMIVPLYSDGFSFSLMAITDDGGESWHTSTPIVGLGSIQPSLVERSDGSIVAYMRDNGPPPKRIHLSESRDRGETWTAAVDSELPNPGSSAVVLGLENGNWVLVYNDLEAGRYSLAVALSNDEGKTWSWKNHLERDDGVTDPRQAGRYHYPSILQDKDGSLHVTYSYFEHPSRVQKDHQGQPLSKGIKHAHFNEAWIRAGD